MSDKVDVKYIMSPLGGYGNRYKFIFSCEAGYNVASGLAKLLDLKSATTNPPSFAIVFNLGDANTIMHKLSNMALSVPPKCDSQ
jgi:hypothetical protein